MGYRFSLATKNDIPLNFIGQIACNEINFWPSDTGYLLFFYSNRHWGYSPKDRGHAVVIHQVGEQKLTTEELPEFETKHLFGLIKRKSKPTTYELLNVEFESGRSYPTIERNRISFDDEVAEECYDEFCTQVQPSIQIGGYPFPIQSDDMETDCVRAYDFGVPEDWILFLQLFEIGDMTWGDAGALYWFIHRNDLHDGRLDRVWMVSQCH